MINNKAYRLLTHVQVFPLGTKFTFCSQRISEVSEPNFWANQIREWAGLHHTAIIAEVDFAAAKDIENTLPNVLNS